MGGTQLLGGEEGTGSGDRERDSAEMVGRALLEMEATRQKYSDYPWVPDEVTKDEVESIGADGLASKLPGLSAVGLQNLDCLVRSLESAPETDQNDLRDQYELTRAEMVRRTEANLDVTTCAHCSRAASIHDIAAFGAIGTIRGTGENLWCFDCGNVSEIQFDSTFSPKVSVQAREAPTPGAARAAGNAARGQGPRPLPALVEARRCFESPEWEPAGVAEFLRDDWVNAAGWSLGFFALTTFYSTNEVSGPSIRMARLLESDVDASIEIVSAATNSIREIHGQRAWRDQEDPSTTLGPFGFGWPLQAAAAVFDSAQSHVGGELPDGEVEALAGWMQSGYAILLRGPASERART